MKIASFDDFNTPKSTRIDSFYATEIVTSLDNYLTYKVYPKGYRISFSSASQSNIYLFTDGVISLYRQPDDILIEILDSPTMRGIIPIPDTSHTIYVMQAITPIKMATISTEQFYSLLSQLQLWECFAKHLQLVSGMAAEVIFKLTSPSIYDIVRLQLYELMSKPKYIRECITAENYIKSKTRISRATIMRILTGLKKGGYVSLERGVLKNITRLPKKF